MNYSVQLLDSNGMVIWGWLFLTELQSRVLIDELAIGCLMCYDGSTGTSLLPSFQTVLDDVKRDPVKYGLGAMNPGGLNDVLSFLEQFIENVQTNPECIVKISIV